jgi:hypothetical protein
LAQIKAIDRFGYKTFPWEIGHSSTRSQVWLLGGERSPDTGRGICHAVKIISDGSESSGHKQNADVVDRSAMTVRSLGIEFMTHD